MSLDLKCQHLDASSRPYTGIKNFHKTPLSNNYKEGFKNKSRSRFGPCRNATLTSNEQISDAVKAMRPNTVLKQFLIDCMGIKSTTVSFRTMCHKSCFQFSVSFLGKNPSAGYKRMSDFFTTFDYTKCSQFFRSRDLAHFYTFI